MSPTRTTKLTIDDIPEDPPSLSKATAQEAMILATAVRNAMEDFHCKHLSDEQMKELNPIIRNAIATALYALEHASTNPRARSYVQWAARLVPDYWEPPKLISEFSRDAFLNQVRRYCRDEGKTDPAAVVEMAEGLLNEDE